MGAEVAALRDAERRLADAEAAKRASEQRAEQLQEEVRRGGVA